MAKSKTAELLAMFARFLPPAVARFRGRGRGRGRGRVQLPRSRVWVIHKLIGGVFHENMSFLSSKTILKQF